MKKQELTIEIENLKKQYSIQNNGIGSKNADLIELIRTKQQQLKTL